MGPYMLDRENYFASAPAIWAAWGALAKPLTDAVGNNAAVEAMADGLISRLRDVDWRKDEQWVGIAVKNTSGGYSFAGGAKDSGSAPLKALSESDYQNFGRLRKVSVPGSRRP